MRNFITIRNEKERKIFLDYCKKHNIKLISGTEIFINMELFPMFKKAGFQIFFGEHFDYLTYSTGTTKYNYGYNEMKFNDVFKISNIMELE